MGMRLPPPRLDRDAGCDAPSHCPECDAPLDGRATPPGSIVICARCCAPLLWDTEFSMLTADQLRALPAVERERLCVVVAIQRARLGALVRN